MKKQQKNILWFKEITKDDIALAGGKGANLGEMSQLDIPVPLGFVVLSTAYYKFLDESSLRQKIKTELNKLDTSNSKKLEEASKNIQVAILRAKMSKSLEEEIKLYYHDLCGQTDKPVAVRSSATAEDLPDASFAGQQETFLNREGHKEVIEAVQKCWASLFEARAIFYRQEKKFDHFKVGIAVPVQLMVQSEVSGIMFTVNPINNDRKAISIEAGYGLGQPIVSGEIIPDQYLVSKDDFSIVKKTIVSQDWQLTKAGKIKVSKAQKELQKINDKIIAKLAKIGDRLEKHYEKPQDIEWGFEKGKIYIVQTRPITTLELKLDITELRISDKEPILEGLSASPGAASGKVVILKSPKELNKIKDGDVLVTEMTNPDYVPAMKKACAIVTDKGGRTSHAAIVSRELGIPAVVGTSLATKMLKEGEMVTVDGSGGKVYEGDESKNIVKLHVDEKFSSMKTATKVYINLAEPELAEMVSQRNVEGVGLLRAEFMIAQIGKHPRAFIKEKNQKEFIEKLSSGLTTFAKSFSPRPVVYRATDFKTNEYRNLKGGYEFESEEENPLIGFRGVSRYIKDTEVFEMELSAIKYVRNKLCFKNLHLMLPFVRTVEELSEVKKIVSAAGLRRSHNFKLWMMVEIPSNVILLEDFVKVGIDGVSIGSNDLSMLILGVDRDNEKVASPDKTEMNPAVLWAIEQTVRKAKKLGITSSICGQAPSVYPNLVKQLVDWGITSVSVSPDAIEITRKFIYEAEHEKIKNPKH
ncbi:MAG: phosphoenolpyruvate synthase [bacterium]